MSFYWNVWSSVAIGVLAAIVLVVVLDFIGYACKNKKIPYVGGIVIAVSAVTVVLVTGLKVTWWVVLVGVAVLVGLIVFGLVLRAKLRAKSPKKEAKDDEE
jgi:predicted PurR-regulated permease PerM